jgi:hypothetical protein
LAVGELDVCHRLCIELINGHNLPIAIKVETIQILSLLIPLDQALRYLEDADRLVTDSLKQEPEDLFWLGLLTTTRDLLWKIYKVQGTIKFHREITFGDSYAAAHEGDSKKGDPVKNHVQLQDEYDRDLKMGDPVKKQMRVRDEYDRDLREGTPVKKKVQDQDERSAILKQGDPMKKLVQANADRNLEKEARVNKKVHFHKDCNTETKRERPVKKKVHFQDDPAQTQPQSFKRLVDLSIYVDQS